MNVCCIIPTAGERPEMIAETIASVAAQTTPVEIFIMEEPRDLGMWERVNFAISRMKADTYFILCDDDKILPTFVEETVKMMEQTNADIVAPLMELFGDETGVHGPGNHPFITALIRKSAWEGVGGYDPVAGPAADADFYLSCEEQGRRWVTLGKPLFLYRSHKVKWSNKVNWDEYKEYVNKKHVRKL